MIRENESTTRNLSPDGQAIKEPAIIGAKVERGVDAVCRRLPQRP
jgi:hypothetical protein